MSIESKIAYSIELIKKTESLALKYSPDGFHVAFSGGKDSQVLLELVKMAGVKYHAEMCVTTVDHPALMKFVRRHYPDVKLNRPELNMYDLIRKNRCLPLRKMRFCCATLKEQTGAGTITLLGVRREESVRRARRNEVEISGYKFSGSLDQFNIYSETKITCVNGKDKLMIMPILHWTHNDVWTFIRSRNMPYCELYDMGFKRIGCMFCPMAASKEKAIERRMYPGVEKAYKKAIQYCIDNSQYGAYYTHYEGKRGKLIKIEPRMTADEIFDCWVKNQWFKDVIGKRAQMEIEFENQSIG